MSVLEGLGLSDALRWVASLLVVRATGALLLAAAAMIVLRRASAATRHAALGLTVGVLLGLPLLSGLLPRWELGVLPARQHSVAARAVEPSPVLHVGGLQAAEPSMVVPTGVRGVGLTLEPVPLSVPPARSSSAWERLRASSLSVALLVLWLAGICAGLAQFLVAAYLVRRTARAATPMTAPEWTGALAQAAAYLGLKRSVRLLASAAVGVPVVYGYRQAVVLLPENAGAWPQDRRAAFLLHELAHVARRDCLTQTLTHVARLVYWPNPLAWWLVRRLRAEAERACDDRVLNAGTPASDYAAHLLDAARELHRTGRPLAVLAVVERSRFEDRLLALLDPGLKRGALTARSLAFGAGLSLVVACSVAALQPVARVVTRVTATLAPKAAAPQPTSVDPAAPAVVRPAAAPEAPVESAVEPGGIEVAPAGEPVSAPVAAATLAEPEWDGDEATSDAEPTAIADAAPASSSTSASGVPADAAPLTISRPAGSVPVIRISTEMIQIDAVVTDRSGTPVVDLKPEDFEVYENGRRQRVSHLVYVKTGQGPTTGGAAALAAAPETTVPRTMLFIVDDTSMTLESIVGVRKALVNLVNTLEPSDRACIAGTHKNGPLYLSNDRAVLAKSAAEIRFTPQNRTRQPFLRNSDDLSYESRLAADSLQMLKGSVEALRGVPGRKAVIFLSEGFPRLISNDLSGRIQDYTYRIVDTLYDDSGFRAAMNSLIDLANRSSVVIYTIDAAGLRSGLPSSTIVSESSSLRGPWMGSNSQILTSAQLSRGAVPEVNDPITQAARMGSLDRQGHQDSLIELAEETGGIAVHDSNDMGRALEQVLADHAGYYLIGYEPDASTFAPAKHAVSFHELKVRTLRPGLRVRSRKGFYGVSDERIAQAAPPAN